MIKTKIFKIFCLIFLLQIFFIPQLALAIAFGHIGGVPANIDPNNELSKSYFIYNLPPGESFSDELLVQNLAENEQKVRLFPVDSVPNNLGNFACEREIDPKDEIGQWIKFRIFTFKTIPKKDLAAYWQELAIKKEEKKISLINKTNPTSTTTDLFKVSEIDEGIKIENLKNKFVIADPLGDPLFATSSEVFIIPTSTEDFIYPTSTEELLITTTTDELIIDLLAGQKKKVPFTINIPQGVDTGEHSGGIIITPLTPPQKLESTGVMIKTQICVRAYETVPGEIVKKIKLISFELGLSPDKKNYQPTLKVKNESNISLVPDVKMTMSGFGLAERFKIFKKNEKASQVRLLRNAEVIIHETFSRPYFGHFNFQAEVSYDSNFGKEILKTKTISIWVIPWRDLIALTIVLLVLAVVIYTIIFWRKRKYSTRGWKLYTISLGENLVTIADKYNISWKFLAKANKLKKPYIIKEGQTILVPDSIELTQEAKITFNQIIKEKIMSRLYSVVISILIIGVVIVGAVWLYNKIFSKTTEMEETNINQQISPEIKLPLINTDSNTNQNQTQLPASASTEPIVGETSTTTPTTTPIAEADKSIKISILNGSGTKGQAGKVAEILSEAGWLNTTTGNADNFNYQNLLINYQPGFSVQAEEIKKLLSSNYSQINLEEKADSAVAIEIVIGA